MLIEAGRGHLVEVVSNPERHWASPGRGGANGEHPGTREGSNRNGDR